jgi:8-oxo-dGTP diphosphatase
MDKNESMSLWKSLLLFLVAAVLLIITAPFGFVYAIIRQGIAKQVHALSVYLLELAIALDNLGNALMQHVLNDALLIKNDKTYFFGNKLETISSVIGKNSITGTLSFLGLRLNGFLHWIDANHSLNSINYDIKRWKLRRANA